MANLTDLEYLRLSKPRKILYKVGHFFTSIPGVLLRFFKKIWELIKKCGRGIRDEAKDIWTTFRDGSWQTKVSYLVMGFGNIARGQILRGILFLLFEAVFIFYMINWGFHWLYMFGSLGLVGPHT